MPKVCTREKWGDIETSKTNDFYSKSLDAQEAEIRQMTSSMQTPSYTDLGPMGKSLFADCLALKNASTSDRIRFAQYLDARVFWLSSEQKVLEIVSRFKATSSPYQKLIDDKRYEVSTVTAQPINTLVRVEAKIGSICSGAFIVDLQTIATAAHCFGNKGNNSLPIKVHLVRENGQIIESLPAIIAEMGDYEFNGKKVRPNTHDDASVDWAILRLAYKPKSQHVQALEVIEDNFKFGTIPRAISPFLSMGFPGDWPGGRPVFKQCKPILREDTHSKRQVESRRRVNDTNLVFDQKCAMYPGDSGGPMIFWDRDADVYRLAGILTGGTGFWAPDLTALPKEVGGIRAKLKGLGAMKDRFGDEFDAVEFDGSLMQRDSKFLMNSTFLCALSKYHPNLASSCNLSQIPELMTMPFEW
ncbi:hypothetical protein B9Z51_05375 [Limnohabitans sp. T6-5]|uniref:trypsin-like serine peptidase n=1 Tax=Limnohabitans sp. T6-5 TaxID=1100724 RepID=UPI000D376F41|nr:trypsin-like serine protease [Limnohabitans sp. T6-5]PUE11707.1 hypothetical protein B9Z51_05375 [Limnohabitans sp. T6-5]